MMLLVDIGNTRIKWSRCVDGELSPMQAAPVDAVLPLPPAVDAKDQIRWLSSCGDAARVAALAAHLQTLGYASVQRVGPPVSDARLTLSYAEPSTLGVDRWLAMRAARQLASDAFIVASIGTALTVDAVSADGTHLGGCIAPGPRVMRQALLASAAHLDIGEGRVCDFARSTEDGVRSGPVLAAAALIERQHRLLTARSSSTPSIWLTGGDADEVAAQLSNGVHVVPDLVLRGLLTVASD